MAPLHYFRSLFITFCLTASQCAAVTDFIFGDNDLMIWLYTPSIVRVSHLPPTPYSVPTLYSSSMVEYIPSDDVPYQMTQNNGMITISTSDLVVRVDNKTKSIAFLSKNKKEILSESVSTFIPSTDHVLNTPLYDVQQEWTFNNEDTAIFGFGSYQNGIVNYRDQRVRCVQFNTEICIPMMTTNQQYGILWNNDGATTLNYKSTVIDSTKWKVQSDDSWFNMTTSLDLNVGSYSFFLDFNDIYSFGARSKSSDHYLWQFLYSVDGGSTFIEHDAFGIGYVEMPSSFSIPKLKVTVGQGIELLLRVNNSYKMPTVYYRAESNGFDIKSLLSEYIDYFYIYSPTKTKAMDNVIGGYRMLTGGPPQLYSLNVYGLWHSQNTFGSGKAVIQCAEEYRKNEYPVDNIVQDFYYWGDAVEYVTCRCFPNRLIPTPCSC